MLYILILIVVYYILRGVVHILMKPKCEHKTFYETMACDAVCMECGKNMGFIGNIDRTKHRCVAGNDPNRWNMKPKETDYD